MTYYKGFPMVESENSIITVKENGKKIEIENNQKKRIYKVHIDCKDAPIVGKRCDYLFFHVEECLYFVELKGCNVDDAFKQLENTLRHFRVDKSISSEAIVVSSRVPHASTLIQTVKLKFMKNYGAKVTVKNHHHKIAI